MKKIRRFIESNREGQLSKLHTMGGTYHAVRLDEDHIFGVVELDSEQVKVIDNNPDITLLPTFSHRTLRESKNPSDTRFQEHVVALSEHGISIDMSSDQVVELLIEKFQSPLLQ